LLAHRSEQVLWRSLDIICNPDSLVANNNKGLQQAAPLDQRNARQIAILPAQQVEQVVLNPRRFSPEILQEVEIRAAVLIDGNQFSVYNRSFRQSGQRFDNVGKLPIQRLPSSGE
jgi:hypothetical protein